MLRVLANHPHYSLAVDDLAFVANFLYRCSYLHNSVSNSQLPVLGATAYPSAAKAAHYLPLNGTAEAVPYPKLSYSKLYTQNFMPKTLCPKINVKT
jgi:hypothetical protein